MFAINGADIINFIEKTFKVKLPENGLLAGQSVCSVYLYLTKQTNNVHINDIDIFYNVNHYDYYQIKKLKNNTKKMKDLVTLDKLKLNFGIVDDYDNLEGKIILNPYNTIISTFEYIHSTRNDLLNIIYYKGNNLSCIEHFDINCTKIGVDLKTKKLIKSSDFIDFEKNLEIKITNFDTPFHSIIRLNSKISQFKFKSSFEENVLLTNTVINSIYSTAKRFSFGEKYKEKIDVNLKSYYNINNIFNNKLFNLIPTNNEKFDINIIKKYFENNNVKNKDSELNFYIINNLRFLYEENKVNNKKIYHLLNNPLNKQKFVYEYLGNNFNKDINVIQKIITKDYNHYRISTSEKMNNKQEIFFKNEYIRHLNLDNQNAESFIDIINYYEKKYNINLKNFILKLNIKETKSLIKVIDNYMNNIELYKVIFSINYKKNKIIKLECNAVFCYNNGISNIFSTDNNTIYKINDFYFKNIENVCDYLNILNIECNIKILENKFREKERRLSRYF